MSSPVLARSDADGRRLYLWGDPPEGYWSVTTILDGGIPKYLVPWAAKVIWDLIEADVAGVGPYAGAHPMVRRWAKAGRRDVLERQATGALRSINPAKLTDHELAGRWIKGAPDRVRDAAGELGTEVHSEADRLVQRLALASGEAWSAGRPIPAWPTELHGHMTGFVAWLDAWRPRFLATEATVFNRTQAFAGTLDAIVELRARQVMLALVAAGTAPEDVPGWLHDAAAVDAWVTVIIDYKSGNKTWPLVALQLAAYSRGEFVGLPDGVTQASLPAVDLAAVLHLTPKGFRFRRVRIDDEVWRSFLHAREVWRWQRETSRTAFLEDLIAPKEEVA
jgi:hypothetical protein